MTTTSIKYCHCRFSFDDARYERGTGRWSGHEVWVCNKCDGLHHVRQVWPMTRTVKRAPRNAIGFLSYEGHGDRGSALLNYSTLGGEKVSILSIHTHNRRPPTMPIQPTDLLLATWERLDHYTAIAMVPVDPWSHEDMEKHRAWQNAKVAARAIAEVLAPMMVPFFSTADEIVAEAVRRWKAREAEDTDYETPGLGQKSLAPHDVMPMQAAPKAAPAQAAALTPKEETAIKMALDSKMFTAEQLAKSYSVPVATIRAIGQ